MILGMVNSAGKYFSVLGTVSLGYLTLAFLTYYISVVAYGIRWKLVLRGMGKDAPFFELVKAILASIFMNNITPLSRSGGEILRIAWLSKKAQIPPGLSAVSIVYERILETIPVFVLFTLAMTYFSRDSIPLLVFVMVVVFLLWIKWESFVKLSLKVFKTEIQGEDLERIFNLKNRHNLNIAGIGLSSIVWLLDVLRLKLIALALGLGLGWNFIAIISTANLLFGLLAFTPGGVGIVEGGLIGTLTYFGMPSPFAVSITLLERFVSYVVSTIVGFMVLVSSGGVEIWRALRSQ